MRIKLVSIIGVLSAMIILTSCQSSKGFLNEFKYTGKEYAQRVKKAQELNRKPGVTELKKIGIINVIDPAPSNTALRKFIASKGGDYYYFLNKSMKKVYKKVKQDDGTEKEVPKYVRVDIYQVYSEFDIENIK